MQTLAKMDIRKYFLLFLPVFILTLELEAQSDTLTFHRAVKIESLPGRMEVVTDPVALQQTLESIYILHRPM